MHEPYKLASILFSFLLVIGLFSISNCEWGGGHFTSMNQNAAQSKTDSVYLKVRENTKDHLSLALGNDTKIPVYVNYEPRSDSKGLYWVTYTLVCSGDERDGEKNYSPEWHSHPKREMLNPGDEIDFKIEPIPRIQAQCRASVRYYDDPEAVKLLLNAVSTEEFQGYTIEEEAIIERAKKDSTAFFWINNELNISEANTETHAKPF